MSEDEQESGCDTVDSSPASDASGHGASPFVERRFIPGGNQNCEPRVACVAPETEPSKPTVRTVVVPPMRVQNNNNNPGIIGETLGNTGKKKIIINTKTCDGLMKMRLVCDDFELTLLCL